MAGIVQSQVPQLPTITGYNASTATSKDANATGYNPTETSVTPGQTVQGQVKQITDSGSPLMQQAERRANEASNRRGLINSSMAVGESQRAVYDAALPIAQQDANTHVQTAQKNMDAQNAAKAFSSQASNQASLANAQLSTDASKFNASAQNDAMARTADASNQASLAQLQAKTQMDTANLDATTRTNLAQLDATTRGQLAYLDSQTRIQLANMDNQTRLELTNLESQYRTLIQSNQSASEMFKQASASISNVAMQPQLTPEAKEQAVITTINMLREGLAATSYITRTTPPEITQLNLGSYFEIAGHADPNSGFYF